MKKMKLYYGNTGWLRILGIIFPYFIVVGIFQLIAVNFLGLDYKIFESEMTSFQKFIISFAGLLGTFAILWLFVKVIQKEKFINLGFQIKKGYKNLI